MTEPLPFADYDAGCCVACGGTGGTMSGPCWDCRGTGCAHPDPCPIPPTCSGCRQRPCVCETVVLPYPTPWEAGYETMRPARHYVGTIHRMRDDVRRESKRCPHVHGRPDLAEACARRMLDDATPSEPEPCCGHTAGQHGLRRCLALLPNDEPCPCGKGFRL